MGYRILADENVERATINYPRKLDHGVELIGDIAELGLGSDDGQSRVGVVCVSIRLNHTGRAIDPTQPYRGVSHWAGSRF